MPLRASGRPLSPQPPTLGAKTLNVPWIKQEQTQWCWAACADMVLHYYGNATVRQCDLANWLFGLTACCQAPGTSLCNRPCQIADVCRVYNAWSIRCYSASGTVSFGALQFEIDNDRPVESGIAWNGGGGHVVIVRGWYDNSRVYVNDPWYGHGVISYNDLVTAYGLGTWFWTFSNLRR